MKNLTRVLTALVLTAALSPSAFAARNELRLSSLGGVAFPIGGGGNTTVAVGGLQSLGGLGFYQRVHPHVQLGVDVGLAYFSAGATNTTLFSAMVGPQFNFGGESMGDDFYLGALFGMDLVSQSGASTTSALLEFRLGKRMMVFGNVAFNPYVSVRIPTAGGGSTLNIVPLSLSLLW